MLDELFQHPHARAVLGSALEDRSNASHAYLFHGPGGAGKRSTARAFAAELLAEGSPDPASAHARARDGLHPDLTWVAPSGAHEILVSDIDEPVVAAASKTPFEASRRVFVIERVDELGEEAANRMLKTLEEPASFVHLILLTSRLAEVLPTIRSRCQLVRFDAPGAERVTAGLSAEGVDRALAEACARLSLGDAHRARELAGDEGQALRQASEAFARATGAGEAASSKPWLSLLAAVRARGEALTAELEEVATEELSLYPRKEQKRVQTEWTERIRRARRRVQTQTLDLGLQMVTLWFSDLLALACDAPELVRNSDRAEQLRADLGRPQGAYREAIELVEDTRQRFQLNVSEDLACEALAYRLERTLAL